MNENTIDSEFQNTEWISYYVEEEEDLSEYYEYVEITTESVSGFESTFE